jgi:glycosyltransferase involved in cell wall biosynthesis
MRVIHVLDHSLPLATAYALRTIAMLKEQRALGWETFHLTGPRHPCGRNTEEDVDGWHFYRTPHPGGLLEGVPGLGKIELMGEIAYRIEQIARRVRPHILHAHSPIVNAIPALRVGRRLRIPVVYEVRPWREGQDAAIDCTAHGRLRGHLARGVETWVLKRADAITTVCEAMRGDIVVRGIPAEKVTVISSDPTGRPSHGNPGPDPNTSPDAAWRACGAGYRDVYAELVGAA